MIGTLKRKQKSNTSGIALIALGVVGIFVLSFFQAYSIFLGMAELGIPQIALFNGFLIAIIITVISSVMKVTGTQTTNDASLLLSLPISKQTIVLAKTVSKYLFDLFIVFVFLLPYIVLYNYFAGFDALFSILGLLMIVLIPLLSVGLNGLLNYVISNIFSKTRYAALLKSMLSLVFFVLTMVLFGFSMPSYGMISPEAADAFISSFPPISYFLNVMLSFSLANFMIVLCLTFIPFLLGTWLFSKHYGKETVGYSSKNKTLDFSKKGSLLGSLVGKEFKRYFLTPIYVLNTIIGPIFIVIATVAICILGVSGLENMMQMPLPTEFAFGMLTVMFVMFTSLTMISASAISLEGKHLWVLKSLPICAKTLLFAKALPNLLLTAPILLVCSAAISIVLKFQFVQGLLFVLIPIIMSVIVSFGGLLINLKFPRLDWVDETSAVKQSMSVLLAMLGGMAITILPILLLSAFQSLSILTIGWITLALYGAIAALISWLLFTKGQNLLNKITLI